ncbi:DNA polymerase III subunit gamma/tau [Candidatus Dojkabacteria bacterium]|nr:DNA polymerase III subunit gamma/tau [Candidatus Dojkabacteria bacterium]
MTEVIYRKYRPKKFEEVIGQGHIISVLEEQIRTSNLGHAYLFTGSRGTGKTTVARIFASEINVDKNSEGLDVIEIDAASNRGIDDIRELRDKISYAPSKSKYKIYIIDEVHMLTKEAFNALLKTLEEPPKHAIFIFATTEPHKIPITILSRVMRFDFKLASEESLKKKFQYIFNKEKIEFEEEVLELIIRYSNGSFRDGESLITKLISGSNKSKLTIDKVNRVVGFVDKKIIDEFIENLRENNTIGLVQLVKKLKDAGKNLDMITSQLIIELESIMVNQLSNYKKDSKFTIARIMGIINELCKAMNESKSDILYGLSLELALIKVTESSGQIAKMKKGSNEENVEVKVKMLSEDMEEDKEMVLSGIKAKDLRNKKGEVDKHVRVQTASGEIGIEKFGVFEMTNVEKSWKDYIKRLSEQHFQLATVLINTKFLFESSESVIIEVPYSYYKQKLETKDYKAILSSYLQKELEIKNLKITIKHNPDLQHKEDKVESKNSSISNKDVVEDIFNM